MSEGSVKFYNTNKCWGFILPDDGGPDVFVHKKDLRASGLHALEEGRRVRFESVPGRDGKPKAQNISVIQ